MGARQVLVGAVLRERGCQGHPVPQRADVEQPDENDGELGGIAVISGI